MKTNLTWDYSLYDGIRQFTLCDEETDEVIIETGKGLDNFKCRELWNLIKEEYPQACNYKQFCECYKEASEGREAYFNREARRYKKYWGEDL